MTILDHRFKSAKTNGPDATQIQPSHWNDGHAFSGGAHGDHLVRDTSDLVYGAAWATPAPLGLWTTVPYNAANFFTDTAATWAVAQGSVVAQRYTVIGRLLVYHLWLSGPPSANTAQLRIRLPAPYVGKSNVAALVMVGASSVNEVGYALSLTDQDYISIAKIAVGSTFAAGVSATVFVSVTIEV